MSPQGHNSGCLILAPDASNTVIPEFATLLTYLQDSQFIGMPLDEHCGAGSFRVGEAFLQLITFMGCSPYIELEPPANGGPFCYIRLEGPWVDPRLRYGHDTQGPRCHACRHRLPDWREFLTLWLAQPQAMIVECPRCGHKQRPLDLGWRREAGFGRLFIVVENIFPSEAAPVPRLLTGLERAIGIPWQYFYIRE